MSNLTFEFTVNKESNVVNVKREFAAKSALVWDAYTKPEILDRWWGPKPWVAKTKSMDFKVGGRRLYAMVGPNGEEHWAIQNFTSITPKANFKFYDAFCDKEENISDDLPSSEWDVDFVDQGPSTLVNITIKHQTLADLEKTIEMGFKEGFTVCLQQLDEILSNQQK